MTDVNEVCFPTAVVKLAARAVLATLLITFGEGVAGADTWTQWRGPARDGHCDQVWPASLSEDKLRLQYRVGLQPSYLGPIVVRDLSAYRWQ